MFIGRRHASLDGRRNWDAAILPGIDIDSRGLHVLLKVDTILHQPIFVVSIPICVPTPHHEASHGIQICEDTDKRQYD
ncbi:predicted protein [Coccidioides posadasii str. Silveira]|uniref:Predicted protein n=1 Tax=Coccidioides posadasii (strain RMSCC 757 / Silveira) TaxID=443226 RepID=E9DCQ5_COCPS|nr:predicted protein [Coccidioides posadasii str. Silveira]